MIKRILLGIGGTPFTAAAIQRAVELGAAHDAQLTAVTVVDEARLRRLGPVPVGAGAAAEMLREHRLEVTRERVEEALESLKAAAGSHGVKLSVYREQGDPFQLMVSHARHHDLTVFGLKSMFEYNLVGDDVDPADVLNRMAAEGVSPILAVAQNYQPIRRVLVAYGGSSAAAEAMKTFVRMRLWPETSVRILFCGGCEAKARAMLHEAGIYCRLHGIQPELECRSGLDRDEILDEAELWEADLIVLGASSRSSLAQMVFGSTALHVLRNSERTLFLSQ